MDLNNRSSASDAAWIFGQERERALQLLTVARHYYQDGLSQAQIARVIGYSRPTVSRLLEEARQVGIVEIKISHPLERLMHLESLIRSRYDIEHVRVVASSIPNAGIADVGRAAAELFDRIVEPEMTVGLSNGQTQVAMVNALRPMRAMDITFVQMVGSLGGNDQLIDSPELCRRFATAYESTYRVLNAPLLAPNARTALALLSEPAIAATLRIAANADIAVVGVGAGFRRPSDVFAQWLTPAQVQILHSHGAVGHVLGHFFDHTGTIVRSPYEDLVVGLSPDRLRAIPISIGIGAGARKAPAFDGALRGRLINSVILDAEAAQALAYLPKPARSA